MTPDTPQLAAALLAVDPVGLGGAVWRGPIGPERDAWLAELRALLPDGTPWRRMPPQVAEARLLGGLDLAATLSAGRPMAERGLLAEADGGVILVPMAERLAAGAASHLAATLDSGEVVVERDGLALRHPARVAAVLLDEGIDDERPPAALLERLAFCLTHRCSLASPPPCGEGRGVGVVVCVSSNDEARPDPHPRPLPAGGRGVAPHLPEQIAAARIGLNGIVAPEAIIAALAAAGLAFGVPSLRLATLALRTARASAALAGRDTIADEDAEIAAALVIAPRATCLPAAEPEEVPPEAEPPSDPDAAQDDALRDEAEAKTLEDRVLEATRAAIPADLLAALSAAAVAPRQAAGGGRAGVARKSAKRGRPAGTRRGAPGHGARLAIVDTLRAAAPWQRLRRSASPAAGLAPPLHPGRACARPGAGSCGEGLGVGVRPVPRGIRQAEGTPIPNPSPREPAPGRAQARPGWGRGSEPANAEASGRILVRREDFRIGRFKEKTETLTIFVVDASGSAALHRLAEVKGAVELVLAECYVRRDQVALIAFRGERAELALPPTRSLVRAKRALAGLPGGGGTPLGAAIEAAGLLAVVARKKGQVPLVVLLTDGKANVARNGRPGRAEAEADAAAAARAFRLAGAQSLLLDIAPRPAEAAARLAAAMGARYIPLPYPDAQAMSRVVRAAAPAA